jgi:hypothetical protein
VGPSQEDIGDDSGRLPRCWNSVVKMKPLGGGAEQIGQPQVVC